MQYPQQRNDPTAWQIIRVVLIVMACLFGMGIILFCCVSTIVLTLFGGSLVAFLSWVGIVISSFPSY
jgi:hypothetical protein